MATDIRKRLATHGEVRQGRAAADAAFPYRNRVCTWVKNGASNIIAHYDSGLCLVTREDNWDEHKFEPKYSYAAGSNDYYGVYYFGKQLGVAEFHAQKEQGFIEHTIGYEVSYLHVDVEPQRFFTCRRRYHKRTLYCFWWGNEGQYLYHPDAPAMARAIIRGGDLNGPIDWLLENDPKFYQAYERAQLANYCYDWYYVYGGPADRLPVRYSHRVLAAKAAKLEAARRAADVYIAINTSLQAVVTPAGHILHPGSAEFQDMWSKELASA